MKALAAFVGFALAFALVTALLPARSGPPAAPRIASAPAVHVEDREEAPTLPAPRRPETVPGQTVPGTAPPPEPPGPPEPPAVHAGTALVGVVTTPDGAPIEGAWVGFQDADGGRVVGTSTDDAGRYALGPLPPSSLLLSAGKLHFQGADAQLELRLGESLRRQDFVLRPLQRIAVRLLTSSGAPALEALAAAGIHPRAIQLVPVATREDPGEVFTQVSGSLNTPFGIGGFWQGWESDTPMAPGVYGLVDLHEDAPAWLSLVACHQVLRKQPIDPETREVTFVVDPEDVLALRSAVHAVLVDAQSGAPLAGEVWLGENAFPMGAGLAVGDDGDVRLEDQWPGERSFLARAAGRALVVLPVTVPRGSVLELGDVLLHEAIHLRGSARLASGAPVEAVLRWGRQQPGGAIEWVRQRAARSQPDGSFEIADLEPGLWVVQSPGLPATPPRSHDASAASLAVRVDASRGSVEDVELVLLPTTAVTLVTEDVREPWPRAEILDPLGLPADSAWPGRFANETTLRLPRGAYTLVVEREGVELVRRPLAVGDAPVRVELELP